MTSDDKCCSFCDKPTRDVLGMVEREGVAEGCEWRDSVRICNECVSVAVDKLIRPLSAYKNRRLIAASRAVVESSDLNNISTLRKVIKEADEL